VRRNTAQRDRDRAAIRRTGAGCALCGQPIDYDLPHLDPMAYVVDHVVPLALGGLDTLGNKQAAHRTCNRSKGMRVDGGPILRRSGSLTRGGAPPPANAPSFSA